MHRDVVDFIICPHCKGDDLSIHSFKSYLNEVLDGVIVCDNCENWLRIENGILDLLSPPLRNQERYEKFASKYELNAEAILDSKVLLDQVKDQQQQIDFFAVDSECYERDVTQSPYFDTLDEVVFKKWVKENVPQNARVLEVGVGTGRQCVRLAEMGASVVGVDISEEMLLVARQIAISKGMERNIDLIVADACQLPCKECSFDAGVSVGTLHHVPNPEKVLSGIGRSVKAGSAVFTYDPHDSPVRFIFDAMMRWWKLYDEEASDDPLFSREDIYKWMDNAAISGVARVSTYLPPHLFYLLPANINRNLLRLTDALFGGVPLLKNCGGMVIFEGFKNK